jgi:hypothetical protein
MTTTCAECDWERAEVRVSALGIDVDVPIEDGVFLIDRQVIEDPSAVDIEAVCPRCGRARFLTADEWRWA